MGQDRKKDMNTGLNPVHPASHPVHPVDGLAIGRCCVWVVVRSSSAEGLDVEHVMLCVLVGAEMMELRRLVPGETVIEDAAVRVSVPWKLTAVEVWRRSSLVRLASVDDMRPVWNRKEDFIIWGETLRTTPYNGSMQMMTAGARKQIFEDFDPVESPKATVKAGYHGSDQAWISYKLGPHEARWSRKDGIFSYRMDVRKNGGTMPKGARLIFFEGHIDPWSQSALSTAPWIRDHWK
jgi:hypothetical protein